MSERIEIDASTDAVEARLEQRKVQCAKCGESKDAMLAFIWNADECPHTITYCFDCAVRQQPLFTLMIDAITKMPEYKGDYV